jgi:hypothetical protein
VLHLHHYLNLHHHLNPHLSLSETVTNWMIHIVETMIIVSWALKAVSTTAQTLMTQSSVRIWVAVPWWNVPIDVVSLDGPPRICCWSNLMRVMSTSRPAYEEEERPGRSPMAKRLLRWCMYLEQHKPDKWSGGIIIREGDGERFTVWVQINLGTILLF